MNIIIINHGIASVINGDVYVNKRLLDYPELYKRVMAHEMQHINGADYTLDWSLGKDDELDMFVLKNPSTWTQFSPIWFIDNKVVYSKTMLWLMLVFAGVLCVGVSFYVWMASML